MNLEPPQRQIYKGHLLLNLTPSENRWPFKIGLKKARLILANLPAIRAFVQAAEQGRAFLESHQEE